MPLTLSKSILAIVATSLLSGSVFAQFGNDATSKAKLANACAISGGGNPEDYQSYASGLAVTLSHLSAAEQEEVLDGTASGNPSGGSGGETESESGGSGEAEAGETGTGGSGPSGWGSGGGISSWFTSNTLDDPGNGNIAAITHKEPQKATAAFSFTNAPITETVISGEFNIVASHSIDEPTATSGTMTQSVDPTGKPIFRAEDNRPREDATISFKNGKLSFGSKKEGKQREGGKK